MNWPGSKGRAHVIRVLSVNAPALCEGTRALLEHSRTCVTAEAGTAADAFWVLATGTVDVVLWDLGLPDQNGVEVAERLMSLPADTAVVVATAHNPPQYRMRR
ncbi:MAG: response regulator [Thermaerobacter sp.]|nr:response regulator [Thermaerobacter sp.]